MKKSSNSIEDLLSNKGKAKLSGKTRDDKDKAEKEEKKGRLASEMTAQEKLDKKLKGIKTKSREQEVQQKAKDFDLDYIDLTDFPVSSEALKSIPENTSKQEKIVCFVNTGEQIRLGTTEPDNPELEKIQHQLEESFHAETKVYLISQRSLEHALKIYGDMPKYKKPKRGVEIKEEELEKFKAIANDFTKLNEHIQKVSITELVSFLIAAAIQADASDIHVEAEEEDVKIRFRVDGILHDSASLDKKKWSKIISRIKLLAHLKLNITDKPQDGRFSIKTQKEDIDVRVSTLPTNWGESVVMRLLYSSSTSLKFDELGLIGKSYEDMKTQAERPNGMIITTGPTGSGKTTTLYAILNKLNTEDVKIITLEDPIEYKLEGVNQSQIDHSKGYSFADGLKSMLRQDPDIAMVGELRDLETAEVAINAALTGHLVISTLHTNSAAGAIPRFLSMGVKPFLLAPALNAVMGQRLVRRLCEKCKKPAKLDDETKEKVKKILNQIPDSHPDKPKLEKMEFHTSEGCEACHGLGYKGRIGIYEIMVLNKKIEDLVLGGNISASEMEKIAVENGMMTMAQDGLIKALKGTTSVDEIFRVTE